MGETATKIMTTMPCNNAVAFAHIYTFLLVEEHERHTQ